MRSAGASLIVRTREPSDQGRSQASGKLSASFCSRLFRQWWSHGWSRFTKRRGPADINNPQIGARRASFRYAFDPIFIGSIALFAVNRWLLKPSGFASVFSHGYVNDLLCLPIFLPMSLLLQRWVRIRSHDRRPLAWEIVQHWIVFSVMFELIVPRLHGFRSTADPLDVVAYFVGGVVAGYGWRWIDSLNRVPRVAVLRDR